MTKPKLALADFAGVVQVATNAKPADAVIQMSLIDFERQVRKSFPLGKLKELAASIEQQGVLEPIIVLKMPDGRYRMISGERRFRACALLSLNEIPAIIKVGLTERQIRAIQVAENNERENLSPYDEAMGVLEDIDNYGAKEAQIIWNRSEGWISKRAAVKRLAEPLTTMFKDEKIVDLEVLLSLNKLHELDSKEFDAMLTRFEGENAPSRYDIRDKLNSIKDWQAKQASRNQQKEKTKANSSASVALASNPVTKKDAPVGPLSSDATPQGKKQKSEPAPSVVRNDAKSHERLSLLREELYDWGVLNGEQFAEIVQKLEESEADMHQTDWVLWSGLLALLLPLIGVLGEEKAGIFMKKLMGELKHKSALEMWTSLHPAIDGNSDDPRTERNKVPDAPGKWHLI